MFNSATIGGGHGGVASRLLAWGLGWEDAGTLANIITGIPRVVHAHAQAWTVSQTAFTPSAVRRHNIIKAVNTPFIPRIIRSDSISSVMFFNSIGKTVKKNMLYSAHVTASATEKSVITSNVYMARHNNYDAPSVIRKTKTEKAIK